MSTIDTFVPGVPSEVVACAEYVSPRIVDTTRDGESRLNHVADLAAQHWWGESFDAYSSVGAQVRAALNEVNRLSFEVSEVLWAYAGQIGRMESDFADMRDRARERGLSVEGAVIHAPSPPRDPCPPPGEDGYDDYVERADLILWFNQQADEVGMRWGELEIWIAEHLAPLVHALPTRGIAETLLEMIEEDGWSNAANVTVDGVELHWQTRLPEIEHRASQFAEEADLITRRSGNPAVRAARELALAQGLPDSLNTRAGALDDVARVIRQNLQWLPFVGPVIDVVDAGVGLAQGDSIVDIAVEYGGGAAAVAAVSVVAGAVGVTGVAATVALPVAAAVGGSMLASWLYEEIVPLHVREGTNETLEDFWEFFVDTQSDPGQVSW